jgi:hypothetical protein
MTRANPFKRPGESAQKTGYRFERYFAKIFGVSPTRGSGSQWTAKMDVGDGTILWSLKHTDAESFRVTQGLMREVIDAINGPGGVGGDVIPGLAISVQGEIYTVLRADDLIAMLTSDEVGYIRPSKGEAKRRRARVPNMFKDEIE